VIQQPPIILSCLCWPAKCAVLKSLYGGVEIYLLRHYMDVSGRLHAQAALTPGYLPPPPGTHWIGGSVGPRAGLDFVKKRKMLPLPGIKPRQSSPSLYRLRYPDSAHLYFTVMHSCTITKTIGQIFRRLQLRFPKAPTINPTDLLAKIVRGYDSKGKVVPLLN
jgi:hypothetical protein